MIIGPVVFSGTESSSHFDLREGGKRGTAWIRDAQTMDFRNPSRHGVAAHTFDDLRVQPLNFIFDDGARVLDDSRNKVRGWHMTS